MWGKWAVRAAVAGGVGAACLQAFGSVACDDSGAERIAVSSSLRQRLDQAITSHPDFPKPGIVFKDIFPLFQNMKLVRELCQQMAEHARRHGPVDAVVGLDSRGFLFGPLVAEELGCAFVPVRKKGKLPGKTVSEKYGLEYGKDEVEIQVGSIKKGGRVIVVDDLIATGGTMAAAVALVTRTGAEVRACYTVISLDGLLGAKAVPAKCFTVLNYD